MTNKNDKLAIWEWAYYAIGAFCMWSSKAIHIDQAKAIGSEGISYLSPVNIFAGAISPIFAFSSNTGFAGIVVGIFILITPFIGIVAIHDYKNQSFGALCLGMAMACSSQIVSGSWYNIMAGLGGLAALIVVGAMVVMAGISMAKDEAKKQLGIETEDEKRARLKKEDENRSLLEKLLNVKKQ